MDFTLSEEQRALQETYRRAAEQVIAPGAPERDREGRWDMDVWREMARHGLAGLPVPEQYGGSGAGVVDTMLVNEAIGEAGRDGGFTLSLGAHWVIGAMPLVLHGTDEQKARWLPSLADGSAMAAWASTEPEAGSDSAAVRTTARRDGSDWVLNGSKIFITNGSVAAVCHVLARTEKGVTAFVVDTTTPGFVVARELDKLGCRSSPTAEIVLDDCRVPADAVLGVEGEALWRIAFECFDWERTVMLGASVGGMAAGLQEAIAYAKAREQFGRPIASFQAIQHKIADMKINLETCRMAVYRAAWLKEAGLPHSVEASVAKTLVGKLSVENALENIQIHGGYGYTKDFPAERSLRDAKLVSIGGGTSEIQKMIISRELLGG